MQDTLCQRKLSWKKVSDLRAMVGWDPPYLENITGYSLTHKFTDSVLALARVYSWQSWAILNLKQIRLSGIYTTNLINIILYIVRKIAINKIGTKETFNCKYHI